MNWAIFALAVSAVLLALWVWRLTRKEWTWTGLYVSFACLVTACFHAAAPVRGLVDANYEGYGFGMLRAEHGLAVTLLAGPVFLAAAASALIAASRSRGRELWVVAITCAALFVISGIPTLMGAYADPVGDVIQFGEYLTIPGLAATAISLLLLCVPFAVGTLWAARAATRPQS